MYQMLKSSAQKQPVQKEGPNTTGIPTQMKLEFEERSGSTLDDVKVQYNSEKPAQLQALAYTQGSRIYIAPGQERHLRHELVHVVQQKQGRVRATARVNGMAVNDEERLEREADLGQVPVQMKAGAAEGVIQALKDDGQMKGRSTLSDRMYNNKAYKWTHYSKEEQKDIVHDEGSIHHIIPHETLQYFWNIIVDCYPDLWGGMVKDILEKIDGVLGSEDSIYLSEYKRNLLSIPEDGTPEIGQKIRDDVANEIKNEIKDSIRNAIRDKRKDEIKNEIKDSIRNAIRDKRKDEIKRTIQKAGSESEANGIQNDDGEQIEQKVEEQIEELDEERIEELVEERIEELVEIEFKEKVEPTFDKDYGQQIDERFNTERKSRIQKEIENKIQKEIDREAQLLQDRAFLGTKETLPEGRPEVMGSIGELIGTAYSWMPGNLVIGPLAEDRSDDPGSTSVDIHALGQKHFMPEKVDNYEVLHYRMEKFIGKEQCKVKVMDKERPVNLHQERKEVMKALKAHKENKDKLDAAEFKAKEMRAKTMESEARTIIDGIVNLLAGQGIVNNTVWQSEKVKEVVKDKNQRGTYEVRKKIKYKSKY